MEEVYIVDAVRTPIGRYGGALSAVRADDLMAGALEALVARTGLDTGLVDDVILGCANQAGEDNRNVARMALLLAGFPFGVPGVTVNRLCGSGLETVIQAARAIRAGEADVVVAGGVESMSRAPYSMAKLTRHPPRGNQTAWDTALGWRYPNPRLAKRFPLEGMGETAENVAERHRIGRQDQDAFALGSHRKAVAATEAGHFEAEIIPVEVAGRKGKTTVIDRDEGPRRDTSMEKLARLRAAFREGGSVTAGNSSTLNDGSSALLVVSSRGLKQIGAEPLARYMASAVAGVDPRFMGMGPVPATRRACARAGVTLGAIDSVELNEAFAAQSLAVIRDLDLDPGIVNPSGGAIALGHPLGCSGARIATTLLHGLRRRGGGLGLATACIGVGQGIAAIFEI